MPTGEDGQAVPITWPQVRAFRVARHHLARPAPKTKLPEVVADTCGVQAQIMAAAQLALRVRTRGLTLEDVDRALWRERSLARVWCMRGAVHLVPSKDLAGFVRACSGPAERWATWLRNRGVSTKPVERLIEAASAAMDRPLTRSEIAERVHDSLGLPIEHRGGRGWGSPSDAAGFRVGPVVMSVPSIAYVASYRALACFGPDEGRGSTFVRPDAWLPGWRDVTVEEAEVALLRRYLGSYGPATPTDFAIWSGLRLGRARQIWARLDGELVSVSLDGNSASLLRRDLAALKRARSGSISVRLLPYFDTFLMGHKDRGHLVDRAHYKRIFRPAGWVYPAVLIGGRIAGDWSYERAARFLRLRVQPYEPLTDETKDLVRGEAEDVARFLGSPEAHVTFAKPR